MLGLGGCAIAAACSSFSGNGATDSDAGADGGIAADDSGRTEIPDGTSPDAAPALQPLEAGAVEPICPAPLGPTSTSGTIPLSTPPVGEVEFPFQLASDTKFLFWTAQYLPAGQDDAGTAYNGMGPARIYRIAKSTPPGKPDLLADNQSSVTAVAVDGDSLYWVTWDGNTNALQSVPRDCTAPCTITPVHSGDVAGSPVVRLLVPEPGVLVYITKNLDFFRLRLDGTIPVSLLGPLNGAGFAAASDTLFVAPAQTDAGIQVFTNLPTATPASQRTTLAGINKQSVQFLATDCTSLYAYGSDKTIYEVDASASVKSQSPWNDGGLNDVFGMAADQVNIYFAMANVGGIVAFNRKTRMPAPLYNGNVWNLAIDNEGVYWGEHINTPNVGGKIYWYKY